MTYLYLCDPAQCQTAWQINNAVESICRGIHECKREELRKAEAEKAGQGPISKI